MWGIFFIILSVSVGIIFYIIEDKEEKKEEKRIIDRLNKLLIYLEKQFDGKYDFDIQEHSGSIRLFSEVAEFYTDTWVNLDVKDISVSMCFSDTYKPFKFTKEKELEEIIGNTDFRYKEVTVYIDIYDANINDEYKDPEISLKVADIICKIVLNKSYTKVKKEVQERNKKEQQKRKQKEESILN